ncbi:EthD family reductase [Bacillus horti]|uniref:Uncharacterized protein (TIGR02118 family) n=1 Tax=Caldalkalibacillus horti TaxID=77523 RepID=A0ABT9W0B4_9BACI|nr:EthD family reductase [Bacillus horti]MDQ0166701.1 uncharacterized protein (TIGR02118 family) [Bacillus horti]
MVKLIALYKHPENKEEFNDHYYNVHSPLAGAMPGLEKVEVTEMFGSPAGESKYYLQAELYFKDKATLMASMSSAEGKTAAKDLMGFAGPLVTMMFGEVKE